MFCTLLLVAFLLSTAFSANVLQSSQGTANIAPDSLSALNLVDPSSLEPLESDSSLNIHSTGSPQLSNTTVILPNSSLSGFEYDTPFEYPGLNDLLGATNAGLQCRGETFGFNLSRTSCLQAYRRVNNSPVPLTWGQRDEGKFQVKLPFRLSSYDGFCVLDVVHDRGFVGGVASPLQIKQAALQVLHGCIKNGAPNTGGMIGNVGT